MTLQVSNIAGDGEAWRRHVNPKTHRGVRPAWLAKEDKVREGLHTGLGGYIRSMKRTKRRMQADKGKQGRNTRAMNYTHPLDTDARKGRGDRICGGNLQRFRTTRCRRTQTSGMQWETESLDGTSRDSDPHAHTAVQVQEDGATSGSGKDNTVKRSTQRVP